MSEAAAKLVKDENKLARGHSWTTSVQMIFKNYKIVTAFGHWTSGGFCYFGAANESSKEDCSLSYEWPLSRELFFPSVPFHRISIEMTNIKYKYTIYLQYLIDIQMWNNSWWYFCFGAIKTINIGKWAIFEVIFCDICSRLLNTCTGIINSKKSLSCLRYANSREGSEIGICNFGGMLCATIVLTVNDRFQLQIE